MSSNALAFRDSGDFALGRIARFRRKINLPSQVWSDVWREQHNTAFMVAGAMKADLLADLRGAVDDAIANGTTLQQFRASFDQIVAKHGWQYRGSRNWRTRMIYQTNLRTSYAAGRYRQLKDPAMIQVRPFWKYNHNDQVTFPRPQHQEWDGMILRHNDPWWNRHFPPGGWGCRCFVTAVSPRDMAKAGKLVADKAPPSPLVRHILPGNRVEFSPDGIDPGFDYVPGIRRTDEQLVPRLRSKARHIGGRIGFGFSSLLSVLFGQRNQRPDQPEGLTDV